MPMTQEWQTLLAINIGFFSLAALMQKSILKNQTIDPIAFSIVFQFLCGIFIALFGAIRGQLALPSLFQYAPYLFLMAVLYGLGNIFYFKAIQVADISMVTIVMATRPLFTVIASTIFLSETLTTNQIVGGLAILGGMLIAAVNMKKLRWANAQWFGLLSSFCFGMAVTNDRVLLRHFAVIPYVSLAFIIPAIVTMFAYIKHAAKIMPIIHGMTTLKTLLMCALYATSAIGFYTALQIAPNSSLIAVLSQLSTVTTVVLSVLVLREYENLPRKLAGAVISFLGLVVLNR